MATLICMKFVKYVNREFYIRIHEKLIPCTWITPFNVLVYSSRIEVEERKVDILLGK